MKEAAVGFQCLDCVKQGAATVRPVRAPYGGVQNANPVSTLVRGNVTRALILLNVVAFLLQGGLSIGFSNNAATNQFTRDYAMIGGSVANGEYYRLITAAFLHASIMHIAFNMFALYQLGTALERILGTWRYLAIYFLSAIGGNALSYLHGGVTQFSLGASTAVFGLFGAFYIFAKKMGIDTRQVLGLIGFNLLITFLIPNIDKFGHLGGLGVGLLVAVIFTRIPSKQVVQQALLCLGVLAALVAAVAVKTSQLHSQYPGLFG